MTILQISWIIFLVINLAVIITALKIYFEEIKVNICYKITGTAIIAILTAIFYKSSWNDISKINDMTLWKNNAILIISALTMVLVCDIATLIFTGHIKIEVKRKS
jgi:hypothetical protein